MEKKIMCEVFTISSVTNVSSDPLALSKLEPAVSKLEIFWHVVFIVGS